ncbi:glycoside hydrolase family 65 protein [Streptomyces sp. RK75]|uniref:glycoside hydrolase family 65 protein n=1 Tax=Streptomyces sp. RK75 TaxID=2824895 RepID=UPI001B38B5B9|nr:glycoside hydrolase family 65 protein [Streptomyces sp. RK75]MBQ0865779.1 glycoside hydrolase family 65 protein [Streptomyces sp. RK75]
MSAEWSWVYEGYDPAEERLREALCTLGNGYFATRGASPESVADDHHYPGTYAAGCYDRLPSVVAGHQVENEDMVNLPNWLPLRFRTRDADGGASDWWSPDQPGLLRYRQSLDLKGGSLARDLLREDAAGRRLRVRQQRLVHMGDSHLAALRTTFTAENWSGELEIEAELDATVTNSGVARYRELEGRHLTSLEAGEAGGDVVWVRCRTRNSRITVAQAARLWCSAGEGLVQPGPKSDGRARQRLRLPLRSGVSVHVDKTVAMFMSGDRGISEPLGAATEAVGRAAGFPELLVSHRRAWRHLWQRAHLDVPGTTGRILRLHLFHILQTLSPHTAGLDVGVPARGLHGEAYRGHVFWDELFVLPYFDLHFPEVSRALLNYRHRRLPAARRNASEAGHTGAMFPWQSGSDGREETQTLHLNPRSHRWLPDTSRLQHHVGSAIAYNVWRYTETTGDREFLHTNGAEMLLEIARFWSGLAEYDPEYERYRIRGVMGPDEYHEAYPGSDRLGIDDNAYTNVTASWVLTRALELAGELPQPRRDHLFADMALTAEELERWEDVSRRLRVPFHRGVIDQFDGYHALAELDWERYRTRYGEVRRLDRLLEAEGDDVNRYRVSKQADALMLGYLFSPTELAAVFHRLGYRLDDETWDRTVDFYLPRTSHGSTLSGLVHGWLLSRERRPDAWRYMQEALVGDVADVQGGTTPEGIHLGAMGGTLDLVQRGLAGLEVRDNTLHVDPAPVPELCTYGFSVRFREHWGVNVQIRGDTLKVGLPLSERSPLRFSVRGRAVTVLPGESRTISLGSSAGS